VISIIIPAHNEASLIGATIDSIHAAAKEVGVEYEVIVASDASTDATAEVARQRGAKVATVAHRQIAATRNSGAAQAAGEWLLFVDADTVINAPLLRETVAVLERGAVGGGCRVAFEGPAPWSWRLAIWVFGPVYHLAGLAAGCYVFARRDAFEAVGGFDTQLYASEEVTLSRSLRAEGKFVILREKVMTSGRKLRTYSLREGLALLVRTMVTRKKTFLQREGLDIWYARREEPRDS